MTLLVPCKAIRGKKGEEKLDGRLPFGSTDYQLIEVGLKILLDSGWSLCIQHRPPGKFAHHGVDIERLNIPTKSDELVQKRP